MIIPLNTEYRTLTIYFIIYASLSPQIRVCSPKFVIKFLTLAILLIPKIRRRGTHGAIHSSTPQLLPKNLANNMAEKLFWKRGKLMPNRKPNTDL